MDVKHKTASERREFFRKHFFNHLLLLFDFDHTGSDAFHNMLLETLLVLILLMRHKQLNIMTPHDGGLLLASSRVPCLSLISINGSLSSWV